MQNALAKPDTFREADDITGLATAADGLSLHMARRLYRTASQGQLGKAWRQLRAPPPLPIGPQHGPLFRKGCDPQAWHPTMQQFTKAVRRLKRQKAPDSGGWTTETAESCLEDPRARQLVLQWITSQAGSPTPYSGRRGLVHYHKLVCLDKGNGGVRPILIGTLWTKILSHLLLAQARPDLDIHLEERQFGIGTLRGTGHDHFHPR